MEALKTVVCTHELQGDTGQDFLCFCVAEMSQPVCVCVWVGVCGCGCVCVRMHVWVSSFVGLWLLLANATDLTSECSVLMPCFCVVAPCLIHTCLLAVCFCEPGCASLGLLFAIFVADAVEMSG